LRAGLLVLLVLIFPQPQARSADFRAAWDEAAEFYDAGDYARAVETYSNLMERGFVNQELYYNLGNAYFKAGNLGASIWAYRRALKIDPGMTQARANLDYVRQFNIDKIEGKGSGFVMDIWNHLTSLASSNGYIALFAISWWLIAITLAYAILRPGYGVWLYYLLIVFALIAIFTGSASITRVKQDKFTNWGVLAVPSAEIKEGPGEEFDRIETGHEGLEFRILVEREDNYLIELKNGLKGWVSAEAVLEI
jgi:tetratricopeptide (TPR) repeat protein